MTCLVLFVTLYFCIKAAIIFFESKLERITTYKADPESFFPTIYFREYLEGKKDELEKIYKLQDDVVALSAITTKRSTENPISTASLKLSSSYYSALCRHMRKVSVNNRLLEIKKIQNRIALCHKAIICEKESFLTDNGDKTTDFIFNRQNDFTNLMLTGVTIPMLIGAVDLGASSIEELTRSFLTNPVLLGCFSIILILGSYRLYKYSRNKRSMLRSMGNSIKYTKAELILCIFENAVENYLVERCVN